MDRQRINEDLQRTNENIEEIEKEGKGLGRNEIKDPRSRKGDDLSPNLFNISAF